MGTDGEERGRQESRGLRGAAAAAGRGTAVAPGGLSRSAFYVLAGAEWQMAPRTTLALSMVENFLSPGRGADFSVLLGLRLGARQAAGIRADQGSGSEACPKTYFQPCGVRT
jgi:hypothetical protein